MLFLEDVGVRDAFDVGLDPTEIIGSRYGANNGLPLTVFITPAGEVSRWWLGELNQAQMEEFAAPILSGEETALRGERPGTPGIRFHDIGRRHLEPGERGGWSIAIDRLPVRTWA